MKTWSEGDRDMATRLLIDNANFVKTKRNRISGKSKFRDKIKSEAKIFQFFFTECQQKYNGIYESTVKTKRNLSFHI